MGTCTQAPATNELDKWAIRGPLPSSIETSL